MHGKTFIFLPSCKSYTARFFLPEKEVKVIEIVCEIAELENDIVVKTICCIKLSVAIYSHTKHEILRSGGTTSQECVPDIPFRNIGPVQYETLELLWMKTEGSEGVWIGVASHSSQHRDNR